MTPVANPDIVSKRGAGARGKIKDASIFCPIQGCCGEGATPTPGPAMVRHEKLTAINYDGSFALLDGNSDDSE